MYNRGLFHNWVPKWGQIMLLALLLPTIVMINPIFGGNIVQMASGTGILTEYYMWASNAIIIGMALVLPLTLRIKFRFRTKELFIGSLIVMAIITVFAAVTSKGELVVVSCLIFGVAKAIAMTEMILPFRGMISPDGNNRRFYAVLYPITISSSQVGTFFTANFALHIGWQTVHYYSAGILLIAAMLSVIFIHNQRFGKKLPFYRIDWIGVLLFTTALMSLAYIFAFGKQQDWFNSPYILWAIGFVIVSIGALIIREQNIKRPLLSFKLFKIRQVRYAVLLLTAQGMYMGMSSLMSIYTQAILGYNWMHNASLNLMTLPGIATAGFVAFYWTKHNLPIKMYIFSGFAAYFLYTVMLYFLMVPELNISQLYLPQLFNGYGMAALFISIWIYTVEKIPHNIIMQSVASVMIFRSFVIMSFFIALYGWFQYYFQWQSVGDQAVYFDTFLMKQNSSIGAYRNVQLSAILVANKKLFGYTIIAGLGILIFVLFHQFGRQKYLVASYRVYKARKQKQVDLPEQIEDVAGSLM
jgi:MFS transporter, DHA2 family, multidrug resistance protein